MRNVRSRSVRRALGAFAAGALVAALSYGGCDWFNDPEEANLAPDTFMEAGPCDTGDIPADVVPGDDVTIEWGGSDIDGDIVAYEWTYTVEYELTTLVDTSGVTSDTSMVFTDVTVGDHRFEVAAVDDDGGVDPDPAFCKFTAQEAGGLVDRIVLVEFLTTLVCVYCPNAEEALDSVLAHYGPDELTIISYHDDEVSGPDPLDTPETRARIYWYTEGTEAEGQYPAVIVDGGLDRIILGAPGDDGSVAEGWYRTEIDYRRTFGSPVSIRLSGEIDGGRGEVTARVLVHDALPDGDYVLRTVVIEDNIFAFGHDFGFSARDLLDDEPLTVSAVGDSAVVERSFAVDPSWVVENMDVIAFVQNDDTKEILQSGRLSVR